MVKQRQNALSSEASKADRKAPLNVVLVTPARFAYRVARSAMGASRKAGSLLLSEWEEPGLMEQQLE
ncbi:hypothetical protein DXT94_29390 [Rhizobium sp. ICMP 5592]|nr:hypothetical protein [Rhizobium sp. ICMP 5592]